MSSDPLQEQLLGYLMGALEESEQARLEQQLRDDPQMRQRLARLRECLRPLAADAGDEEPPPALAARTCRRVFAFAERARKGRMPGLSPAGGGLGLGSPFRWSDVAVGTAVLVVVWMLVWPAVQGSRFSSQLAACQANLYLLSSALENYSDRHGGYFPLVPAQGKLAVAGIYAPTLMHDGFLTEQRCVLCPAATLGKRQEDVRVPTLDELEAAVDRELSRLQCSLGGSYGYTLGHLDHGVYQGTRNLRRPQFALVADAPSADRPGHKSMNHGGRGQNVLFEDGHVSFLSDSKLGDTGDDIFVNDRCIVAAGLHAGDAVIGPSQACPLQQLRATSEP